MSPLGKILLYVALAGALAAGVGGYLKIQQYNTQTGTLNQAQASLESSHHQVSEAEHAAQLAKEAQADDDAKLADTTKKLDDLNTQLAAVQKDKDDLTAAVADSKDKATKAQAQLDQMTAALGGQTPDQIKAGLAQMKQQVDADNSEQKILQDQLQAATVQINDLKDAINRTATGTLPPGISGKVTFVNRTWNFVVLNVGLSNGIVPNGELIVYHGRNFLGKIKVTSAEATSSVADILPDAKADIQVGDDVIN
jgi:outer membrane murein-binding lipoprotein Lpp